MDLIVLGDPNARTELRQFRVFTIGETVPDTIGDFVCYVAGPMSGCVFDVRRSTPETEPAPAQDKMGPRP